MTTTAPFDIAAEGRFLTWLMGTGLHHVWLGAAGLPEGRQDYYRRELFKLYLRDQRLVDRAAERDRVRATRRTARAA